MGGFADEGKEQREGNEWRLDDQPASQQGQWNCAKPSDGRDECSVDCEGPERRAVGGDHGEDEAEGRGHLGLSLEAVDDRVTRDV